MKDFKDQLNRAQSVADEGNSKRGSYYNKPAIWILRQDGVQYGVRNVVTDFIGMTAGNGFGSKKMFHDRLLCSILFSDNHKKSALRSRRAPEKLIFRFQPQELAPYLTAGCRTSMGLFPYVTLDK